MNLNNVYSAVIKSLKDNSITAVINGAINLERLKTMYYGYTGPREIEIRFIDPRKFSIAQRKFIFAMLEDIYVATGQEIDVLKEMFYLRFEALQGYKISLKNDSENTMDDATILANIILNFIFENNIPFRNGYDILPANQEYYFYKCITKRVCCICGKTSAEIDHYDKALGRRSRRKVDHTEYTFASLCHCHHKEKHDIGIKAFKAKYHVKGIKLNQDTIKKLNIGG
ncbi:putative HNHc nuclease [Enterococcus faecalis]|uniref:putative HNHc nuclease n=1 Tax=Enterococcus faecalis TaxID=1351 RepID=UPI0028925A94|nr:putative HNHc nuclease [Enterococcus faecalis]MDT2220612.1 putative HNHc nuclease [Enterococcus faecalis]